MQVAGDLHAELAGRHHDQRARRAADRQLALVVGATASSSASRCSSGTPKPRVLPMPVRAWPIRSCPASAIGRVSAWMAKVRSMPDVGQGVDDPRVGASSPKVGAWARRGVRGQRVGDRASSGSIAASAMTPSGSSGEPSTARVDAGRRHRRIGRCRAFRRQANRHVGWSLPRVRARSRSRRGDGPSHTGSKPNPSRRPHCGPIAGPASWATRAQCGGTVVAPPIRRHSTCSAPSRSARVAAR